MNTQTIVDLLRTLAADNEASKSSATLEWSVGFYHGRADAYRMAADVVSEYLGERKAA